MRDREDRFYPSETTQRVATRKEATPAQVALAWLMARRPRIVPLPETTQIGHLDENCTALRVQLSAVDVQGIEDGFAALEVHGARSTPVLLKRPDDGANLGSTSSGGHGKPRCLDPGRLTIARGQPLPFVSM
jgi:hypothetical protein